MGTLTRREMLAAAAVAPAWRSLQSPSANPAPLANMGGSPTAFSNRSRAGAFDIVEHCRRLGLGAVQTRLRSNEPAAVREFRQKIEAANMRAILGAALPREPGDVAAYDAAVRAAREAGAVSMHVPMTDRRYEQFESLDAFKRHFAQCQKSVSLAEPILRKHRMRLAIENHKGWRAAEHAAWMKRVDSEWVGVCFDFGNNIALCEDPLESLRLLGPHTVFCHLKDMAVDAYEDGFLLSEVPLGEGLLDLPAMVRTLQAKDPHMIFSLEMITRDPLKIPVFTDKYWATFDDSDSPLPGRDLARTLDLVRKHPPKTPLPRVSGLAPDAQVALEDELNQRCIEYARRTLKL